MPSEYILVLPLTSALFWGKLSAAMCSKVLQTWVCVAKFCREIAAFVGLLLLLKTSPASKWHLPSSVLQWYYCSVAVPWSVLCNALSALQDTISALSAPPGCTNNAIANSLHCLASAHFVFCARRVCVCVCIVWLQLTFCSECVSCKASLEGRPPPLSHSNEQNIDPRQEICYKVSIVLFWNYNILQGFTAGGNGILFAM